MAMHPTAVNRTIALKLAVPDVLLRVEGSVVLPVAYGSASLAAASPLGLGEGIEPPPVTDLICPLRGHCLLALLQGRRRTDSAFRGPSCSSHRRDEQPGPLAARALG